MMVSGMITVTEPGRRFEVFTGEGQRRRWTRAEKAQIVAESYAGAESVCAVARRHGLASTQLFAWRREAKATTSSFVPVLVEPEAAVTAPRAVRRPRRRSREGVIELEIDGVAVRVGRGADRRTLEAVLRALKASR